MAVDRLRLAGKHVLVYDCCCLVFLQVFVCCRCCFLVGERDQDTPWTSGVRILELGRVLLAEILRPQIARQGSLCLISISGGARRLPAATEARPNGPLVNGRWHRCGINYSLENDQPHTLFKYDSCNVCNRCNYCNYCSSPILTTPSSHSKNSLSKICSQGLGCPETFLLIGNLTAALRFPKG